VLSVTEHTYFDSPTIAATLTSSPSFKSVVMLKVFVWLCVRLLSHVPGLQGVVPTWLIVAAFPLTTILTPVTSPSSPPASLLTITVSWLATPLLLACTTSSLTSAQSTLSFFWSSRK